MSPRSNRRRRFAALFAVLLAPLCCVLPFAVNMTYNDIRLQLFAAGLYNYPLPPKTEVISHTSVVSLLGPAGNHCDFEAQQVMRTKLTQDEIETYYDEVKLPLLFSFDPIRRIGYEVVFLDFAPQISDTLLFTATIGTVGLPNGLDLRCG